ncbi:DUF3080 family protein [Amphritea japonica]|uniref:DUF3080 domain-containing protein n=1 Tax=Amphritea japonica ATCC BAA-1530 TaxID=1278309 RepID=A0A7R6STB4_9GAMM|nr:DUF3080 family protein [Amphritea japonica]BBB26432.1 conserved hypothetical protein [Amphritea japonica ATCC BAA-1530]
MSKFRYCLIILIPCILLSGCDSQQPEQMLETYSNRLANSLDIDSELNLSQPLQLPPYPRRRERIIPVTDLRQGLVEVLNLRHCQLLNLIAERNSSLGKVMQPSKRMVYEIRLYSGLRRCLKTLNSNDADINLIQQVQAIFVVKESEFEAALWNGIFTSEAIERNFSLSEPALPLEGDNGFSLSRQALNALNQVAKLTNTQDQWSEPDSLEQLEIHYQSLYNNRYGSRWLRSISLIRRTLEHSTAVIEQRLEQRPLCYQQQTTPKARIVINIFNKYYAGQLQPYMARIDREGKQWLELNRNLLHNFSSIPQPMQKYHNLILATDAPHWISYIQARDRHTRAWQTLLRQCNLMPGSS